MKNPSENHVGQFPQTSNYPFSPFKKIAVPNTQQAVQVPNYLFTPTQLSSVAKTNSNFVMELKPTAVKVTVREEGTQTDTQTGQTANENNS